MAGASRKIGGGQGAAAFDAVELARAVGRDLDRVLGPAPGAAPAPADAETVPQPALPPPPALPPLPPEKSELPGRIGVILAAGLIGLAAGVYLAQNRPNYEPQDPFEQGVSATGEAR
jgi:hypothetical protein